MIIAVNTRCLASDPSDGISSFVSECFSRLAKKYPQHQFIYVFDRAFNEKLITSKNITAVVTGPEANTPLLWQYWYNYKLPAVLRKNKADIFFSADGICSLRSKIPQCLLVPYTGFLEQPLLPAKSHLRFYKRFTPKFLAKAKMVITPSAFSKEALIKQYKTDEQKIDVVYNAISETYHPITFGQKELIKEKYAEGKEYFLFAGRLAPQNNLVNLLKAFSFFKKRQKSNMQLLIAASGNDEVFNTALRTFKFRNEVKLLTDLSSAALTDITAAAYAFVSPVFIEGFALSPLEAMRCEVPVVCSNTGTLTELCGDAALYVNPADFNDIAEKMMLLFKDENKRRELIKAGRVWSGQYSWDKSAGLLWQSLSRAIK